MSEDGCRLRNQMLIIMHSTAGWNSFFIDSRDGGCGGCSNTTVTRAASGVMACAILYSSRLISACRAECQLIIVKILNAVLSVPLQQKVLNYAGGRPTELGVHHPSHLSFPISLTHIGYPHTHTPVSYTHLTLPTNHRV